MKVLAGWVLVLLVAAAQADTLRTATSPPHRVALLELYTSEGCSSCPPADRWLSRLRQRGIDSRQLVALAFHVTYWDYIGWRDRFAQKKFDLRQRQLGQSNALRTIYTPQFVLNGRDFRRYADFSTVVRAINQQSPAVDLKISSQALGDAGYRLALTATPRDEAVKDFRLYIAVLEHGLASEVDAGENEGEHLQHDYVVRRLYRSPPRSAHDEATLVQSLSLPAHWQRSQLQLAGFVQDVTNGEVLQAVLLESAFR